MKILLVDNYDSFTYNLQHLFMQIKDIDVIVVRNDENFLEIAGQVDGVIISPGPGDPNDHKYFGNNNKLIAEYGTKGLPILGVCLGFQGIACHFGAKLKRAKTPMHGKTSRISLLQKDELLSGIENGDEVMRYHSLMIDTDYDQPTDLIYTAEIERNSESTSQNGREIMALKHINLPLYGVQFHPESFATNSGSLIANNFVQIIRSYREH